MNPMTSLILKDAEQILERVDLSLLKGKTVLITGASGLIGTYLIASLYAFHKKGNEFNLIALMQGEPSAHLKELLDFPGVTILRGDISSSAFVETLPEADIVVHAAGYGQPGKFMEDPAKTLKLNLLPTFALLERLRPEGKFLFVSSSEVYSGLNQPPLRETEIGTTNTDHPRSCYIEGKRSGEAVVNAFRSKGVDAKSARLSLAYGPGTKKDDARVLNSFIQKAFAGNITLMDHGKARRTYCYVADAVEIMWHILLNGHDAIYNVGGTSKTTIADLAKMVGKIANVPVTFPEKEDGVKGAPEDVYIDITKTIEQFGKKDFVPLEEGLERTIAWQKMLYS